MNKKFLSAILFGALTLASTGSFVSCKDYDDDIKNLQTQISTLATKTDVESKLSQLQSTLTSAQSTAEAAKSEAAAAKASAAEALAAAKAADNTAEVAKLTAEVEKQETAIKELDAKLDKIAEALSAVNDALVAIKAEVAETVAEMKADTQKAVTEAQKLAEATVKEVADLVKVMVTEVSLVESFSYMGDGFQGHYMAYSGNAIDLGFKAVTEQTTVFGKGLPGEIKFDETKSHSLQKSNIVVRVNPANATLAKEDIKLINSKGEALDLVEVVEVKKYDGLITKATVENTALWTITVQTKEDVTMSELEKATTTMVGAAAKKVCYAVSIGNEERSVVSTYDITAAPGKYEPVRTLDFYATDKEANLVSVADIHNRYIMSENGEEDDCKEHEEMIWKEWSESAKFVSPAIAEKIVKKDDESKKLYKNVVLRAEDETDNRQAKSLLPVEVNKEIELHLAYDKTDKVYNDIKGFYVAYDTINAVESAPSEWNAWVSYEVENLNVVQEGNKGSITIKSDKAEGDVIGFRVYAVNLDGTLLDPDGRAFYVYVGDATKIGTVPTQPIIATKNEGSNTTTNFLADVKTAFAGVKNSAYEAEGWANTKKPEVKDKDEKELEVAGELFKVMVDGVEVDKDNILEIDFSKAEKVEYVMPDAQKFVDGGTYEQEMKIYKKVGSLSKVLVKTITVSFTKVMPSEAPVVKYITGQTSELLLAPTANPTTLGGYGSSTVAAKAEINLNNVYYELSRKTAGTIKFVASNSNWDATKKAYVKATDGKNAADETDLSINNADADAFKAITNGSAHTIKFYGYYENVSYTLNEEKTGLVTGNFATTESTDFDVTYNCWDKFTTWNWDAIKYKTLNADGTFTVSDKAEENTKTFKPELQWTTAGTPVKWNAQVIKATNTKNPEIFNTNIGAYAAAQVIKLNDAKDIYLEDVENPDQVNNYFVPSFDGEATFTFTKTQNSVNPAKDVKQLLKMKVTDAFGHEIVLPLGEVTILMQK